MVRSQVAICIIHKMLRQATLAVRGPRCIFVLQWNGHTCMSAGHVSAGEGEMPIDQTKGKITGSYY